MEEKQYRPNVAAIIVNNKREMLICARSDMPYVWQIPEGGINEGEDPKTALLRELKEEIGTDEVDIIAKIPFPIKYMFPEESIGKKGRNFKARYIGQEQSYFLVHLHEDAQIDLRTFFPQEFVNVRWVNANEFLEKIIGFKKEAYTTAVKWCLENYPKWLA